MSTTDDRHSKIAHFATYQRMKQPAQANTYSQARLLDALLNHFQLERDSELARRLDMPRSFICRLRKGRSPVGAALLIRMHDESGISIMELRRLLGDRRKRFRGGYSIYSVSNRGNYSSLGSE